jgi:hypothetical protein
MPVTLAEPLRPDPASMLGGRNRDFGPQSADTPTVGRTAKATASAGGPGRLTARGGPALAPGKTSAIGIAAPAMSGRTGNAAGAAEGRVKAKAVTRNYSKPPVR